MTKNLFYLLLLFGGIISAQIPEHATCGSNKITNSTFDVDNDNSPIVTNWTFSPEGDSNIGWKQDKTLIYGTYLFIDRYGKHTASSNAMSLCAGGAKLVKFAYNSANVGQYSFKVKLGGQELISFSRHGGLAQSNATLPSGVSATIDRKFLAEGSVNIGVPLGNNVWHDVVLYVSNYTGAISGELELEYEKTGYSRQIRIDNVEVYDALPKPELTNQTKELASCDATTADLTTGLYTPKPGFSYEWHTVSSNPSASTLVANPASAGIGIYYLYIKGSNSDCSTGGTANCYSPASNVVTVTAKAGCCGGNKITNPGFDGNSSTGWTLEGSAQLVTNSDYTTAMGDVLNVWKTPPATGDTWVKLYARNVTRPDGVLKRNDIELCPVTNKKFQFDIVVDEQSGLLSDRLLEVSLGGVMLFKIKAHVFSPHRIEFIAIKNGVTILVKRGASTFSIPSQNNQLFQYSTTSATLPYRYTVSADINPSLVGFIPNNKELKFKGYAEVGWFLDNISLSESKPTAASPTSTSANANCATNTYNLTTTQPTTAGFKYIWYDGANPATANRIADPTKVAPGTYYMQTISECSTCKSDNTTAFTVNQNCPIIKGTLYADYDGASNGIDKVGTTNSTAVGHSGGGLYALLVDSTGKVVRTSKINTDGTYQLIAPSVGNHYVLIHNEDVAIGATRTFPSKLNPSYVHTGIAVNGTLDTSKTGISVQFNATANSSTIVDFGTNVQPIPSGGTLQECNNNGAEYKYTGTAPNATNTGLLLYGIDDDPTFNNGEGQKVIIKTLTQTGGVLKYGGITITTVPHTIASYDKTLLTFTPNNATDEAKVEFTYVFEDKAGTESAAAAKISLTIAAKLDATISSSAEGVCLNGTAPVITATGLNGIAPYTFEYNINGGVTKTITTDATTPEDIPLEAIATTATGTFTYNITKVTDYIGCATTFTTPKTLSVSVSEQPQDVTAVAENLTICSGENAVFNISGGAGEVVTYTLNGGADTTVTLDTTGKAVVKVTAATANQTLVLTKVSKNGCELALNKTTVIEIKTIGCPCEKDGLSTGTPRITNVGISTLNRNTENWLSDGNQNKLGAYITLESKEKGFVITRNANPATNIASPQEGMIVWDTTAKCLKLYNGTEWKCISQGCNQ